jgi:transcription elongation factor Elf1
MPEKVYITPNQTATFTCPMCQKSKVSDVSKFVKLEKKLKVKARCNCGHVFSSLLERRKHYRKEINLMGTFIRYIADKPAGRGNMVVKDLSLTGLNIEVFGNHNLSAGDVLEVEFRLDDSKKAPIKKKVAIQNVKNFHIGTTFLDNKEDTALGFYLMP